MEIASPSDGPVDEQDLLRRPFRWPDSNYQGMQMGQNDYVAVQVVVTKGGMGGWVLSRICFFFRNSGGNLEMTMTGRNNISYRLFKWN